MPFCKANECFCNRYQWNKNWWICLNNEFALHDYNLIKIDCSRKGSGVACFIQHSVAYSHKTNMRLNTESIFTEIYLPKPKPFIVSILYRPPDKVDCVNCIEQILREYNTLETQNYYLLRNLNINLLFKGKEIFSNKIAKIAYKKMLPLTKRYLEFRFPHSLEQIITSPTKTTDRTETLFDHVLTNSSHRINQSQVLDVGLSDLDLIFCTVNT